MSRLSDQSSGEIWCLLEKFFSLSEEIHWKKNESPVSDGQLAMWARRGSFHSPWLTRNQWFIFVLKPFLSYLGTFLFMIVFKMTLQYISHCHFAVSNYINMSISKGISLLLHSPLISMVFIMRRKLKELGLFSYIHVIISGWSRPVSIFQPCKCGFIQYFVLTRANKIRGVS